MKSKTRPRTVLNIRINPKIKKEFLDTVKEKKLNICHIAEALLIAWTEGTKNRPRDIGLTPGTTLVVNQKFENVIARGRRRKRMFEPAPNCYTENGYWIYRKPERDEPLSKQGHVLECECSICKPLKSLFQRAMTSA